MNTYNLLGRDRPRKQLTDIRRPFVALAALVLLAAPGCKPAEDDPMDDPYVFADEELSAYTQIDRHGMPAVNAALIMDKEAYNLGAPVLDAASEYVPEITASLDELHAALDDDLTALGFTPCATMGCLMQAGGFVVPDTLKVDVSMASGFPNGRRLTDPVMDVTLALILLDLNVAGQTVTSFVGVLNPTENDKPFGTAFPYVAEPHTP
jgi:Domain of unknown function (DUF4331)